MTATQVIPLKPPAPLNIRIPYAKVTEPPKNRAASFSLEIAKEIWRRYPKVPELRKAGTVVVAQPSSHPSNALELNIGAHSMNDTPSVSPSKSEDQVPARIGGDPDAQTNASAQAESSSSECAVDDLLPTVSDMSPLVHEKPLSPSEPSQIRLESNPSPVPLIPAYPHILSTQEMRSILTDSVWKTIQARYPDKPIDYEKLNERFAHTISDSEVRDFVAIGKEATDQLTRSGKLDVKRKYAGEGNTDGQKRARRNKSNSPKLSASVRNSHISRQTPPHLTEYRQGTQARAVSAGHPTPPRLSDNLAPSKAPIAMHRGGPPPPSPTTPRHQSASRHGKPDLKLIFHDQIREYSSAIPGSSQQATLPPTLQRILPHRRSIISEPLSPGEILEDEEGESLPTSESGILLTPSLPFTAPQNPNKTEVFTSTQSDQADAPHIDDTILPENITLSHSIEARILLAKVGLQSVGLLNASFDLDGQLIAAIRRWSERSKKFDPREPNMKLHLTCIPTSDAEKMLQDQPPDASPSILADSISNTSAIWPQPGTLYVTLNQGRREAVSWAEQYFTASSPPLDISGAVVEGTNDIQFVELGDHSQTLFVVLASPPSRAELQEALALRSRGVVWGQISQKYKTKSHVKLQFDPSS